MREEVNNPNYENLIQESMEWNEKIPMNIVKLTQENIIKTLNFRWVFLSISPMMFLWWRGVELNHRHKAFQASALPLSYPARSEEIELVWLYEEKRKIKFYFSFTISTVLSW